MDLPWSVLTELLDLATGVSNPTPPEPAQPAAADAKRMAGFFAR